MAKESAPKKEASTHPPYLQMITDALTALKERTGSSVPAIAKFLEQKYDNSLPANFRKILTTQLKRLVKSNRIVKIKNSFKLMPSVKAKNVDTKAKKAKGGPSNNKVVVADQKAKVRISKSAKVSEATKVVKKAVKTKRLSLVKSQDSMNNKNKKKGDEKVAAGGAKMKPKIKKVVKKSTSDVPGKSGKKMKSTVGNKK